MAGFMFLFPSNLMNQIHVLHLHSLPCTLSVVSVLFWKSHCCSLNHELRTSDYLPVVHLFLAQVLLSEVHDGK